MISVYEVHVRISRRPKENRVPHSPADRCMRGGIVGAQIGFNFHDASGEHLAPLPPHENLAEEIRSDQARVAIVEGTSEGT